MRRGAADPAEPLLAPNAEGPAYTAGGIAPDPSTRGFESCLFRPGEHCGEGDGWAKMPLQAVALEGIAAMLALCVLVRSALARRETHRIDVPPTHV